MARVHRNVGFPSNPHTRHNKCHTVSLSTMAAVECAFPSLSLCCTLNIFSRLTCWERLRSHAVSPAWRATLSNGLLWRDVDLSSLRRGEKASAAFLTAVGRVANGHITRLDFSGQMWRGEKTAGILRRVGHATLRALHLNFDKVAVENRQMVGDVLGRLIAVPSALASLLLFGCDLSNVGLQPLFQALPGNKNLRALYFFGRNEICTNEFAAEVLDAVRQNTSLYALGFDKGKFPELDIAAAFVSQRSREKLASRS